MIFDAFRYVVYLRASYTTNYMKDRFQKKKDLTDNKSCFMKCGSLLKTLIVYGVVAAFLIPMGMELYSKLTKDGKSAFEDEYEIITTKSKDGKKTDMTAEEIKQRAVDEENERLAKFNQKMKDSKAEMGINDDEDEDYMDYDDEDDNYGDTGPENDEL